MKRSTWITYSLCAFAILGAAATTRADERSADVAAFEEPMSLHYMEWLKHRDDPVNPKLINGPIAVPRQSSTGPAVCRTVFGYLPYWEDPDNIQWDKITHLGAFALSVNSAGNVTNYHGWPWTSTVNTAHAHGVKVHMVVTLFDGASINSLFASPSAKANFFQKMRDQMILGNADGINIDFESGSGWQDDIDEFMGELSAYMDAEIPGSETSIAAAAVNWNGWQYGNLVNNCDIVFIMGYAFWGSWSTTSGPGSPLTGGSINITDTVVDEYASARAVAPEKLVLGIPYYGLHWTTTSSAARSSVIDWVGSVFYSSAASLANTYGVLWDATSQTPWIRYQSAGVWHQIWYDDVDSLRLKYQLAKDYDFGGVGMWALNYDTTRPELWDLIQEEFGDICCAENPPDQAIFTETFEDGSAASRWDLFTSSSDYTADYYYDYSADSIPPAPHSTGGTTRGLKFTVNNNDLVESTDAVSTYPKMVSVTDDFALRFDMWLNYGNGAGTTEFMTAGIGHAGGKVVWPNNGASDGNYFVATGEGGAAEDYRAYLNTNQYKPVHGVYSTGSLNNTDGFYQLAFPSPPFETAGTPGNTWVEVEIVRTNGTITWSINGTPIAAPPALSNGDKVMLGYMDIFSSVANPASDAFVIYDNVRVELLAESDCNGNTVADTCETIANGDFDADGDVDAADLAAFVDCFAGVGVSPTPLQVTCGGTCLSAFDSDGDFDIDLVDFSAFQEHYTGQ
ncbi:MAG: hypothetical protein H6817_09195 [Phycisphaerales bacterium]|nr:hypothetical protein [Phycisphaerales bacterium]